MATVKHTAKYTYGRNKSTAVVRGLHELNENLHRLEKDIALGAHGPVYDALFTSATPMKRSAIAHAPSRTGLLRENIILIRARRTKPRTAAVQITIRYKVHQYVDSRRNRRQKRVGKVYVQYSPAFYARFLEFGTSKMPAHPFLVPAFMENKQLFIELLRASLWHNLKKHLPDLPPLRR